MSALAIPYGAGRRASLLADGFRESDGPYRAHEDWFRRKYRHWRGHSGRSYVFSVYAPRECPAYENAVLIVANGRGAALACLDLGPFPEARLAELLRLFQDRLDEIEFQIHVLAERQGDRLSLIEDIIPLAA